MLAAYVSDFDSDDPVSALQVGERPAPQVPEGWVEVKVKKKKAASLNHHDLWTCEAWPVRLGAADDPGLRRRGNRCRGRGGHHALGDRIGAGRRRDETFDPGRSLLSSDARHLRAMGRRPGG